MDAVGSNIVVNTRCGEVMRILPRMNEVGQPSVSHSVWEMLVNECYSKHPHIRTHGLRIPG